jgi:hypothetical protein
MRRTDEQNAARKNAARKNAQKRPHRKPTMGSMGGSTSGDSNDARLSRMNRIGRVSSRARAHIEDRRRLCGGHSHHGVAATSVSSRAPVRIAQGDEDGDPNHRLRS